MPTTICAQVKELQDKALIVDVREPGELQVRPAFGCSLC